MNRRRPLWRRLTPAVVFFWWVSLLPAEAPPSTGIPPAVWDSSAQSLPSWFGPVQSLALAQGTVWRAPLRPPPGLSRLAATFVFGERATGVARVIWQGSGRSLVLCANLFEGAASWHRRTLLIERHTLGGPGQLVVEASGRDPVLVRVELAWVEPLVLAASGGTPPGLFLASSGKIFPAEELGGQTALRMEDISRGRIVDAVLDPGPVRCDPQAAVRFVAGMIAAPAYGRIQAQVAGLAPGEEPEIWVNGHRLPAVAVELPGLDDPGHLWSLPPGAGWAFAGWRTVVASVAPGWLRRGENQVDWFCPAGAAGMTLRQVRLQVSYETTPPEEAAPAVSAVRNPPTVSPQFRLGLSSPSTGLSLRSE